MDVLRVDKRNYNKSIKESIAVVIGATGLVGTQLVQELVKHTDDTKYSHIICIVRNKPAYDLHTVSYKVLEDFSRLESYIQQLSIQYDFKEADVYSCLGTTLKDAGSKKAFYNVDYEYNYQFIESCAVAGATRLFLLSSTGADETSCSFYLKTKGDLEKSVQECNFKNIFIFRASLLIGKHEGRSLENLGQFAFKALRNVYPKYAQSRPIEFERVASSIFKVALLNDLSLQKELTKYNINLESKVNIVSNKDMLKISDS